MKVFLSIKYHDDHSNRARIEMIALALHAHGFETMCIARDVERWGQLKFDARELMRRTFAAIDACDLVVVDLTEKGLGVGIEAGYARARSIPVVTIAQKGSAISETLRGISQQIFLYDNLDDLTGLFSGVIHNA